MTYINYCISLPESKRKNNALTEFNKINLNVEFINAVNGNHILHVNNKIVYKDIELRYAPSVRKLTPGELGCSLSHYLAYLNIIKNNLTGAFIFEDDVCINYTEEEFVDLVKNLPDTNTFDICYYQSTNNYHIKQNINNYYNIVFADSYCYNRTHAYFLTNKMAKILVNDIQSCLRRVSDGLLGEIIQKQKLTVISPNDRKIGVSDCGSDIHRIDLERNCNKVRR